MCVCVNASYLYSNYEIYFDNYAHSLMIMLFFIAAEIKELENYSRV